jgi:pimeloyl-ACP methyl ester carboxylesterase
LTFLGFAGAETSTTEADPMRRWMKYFATAVAVLVVTLIVGAVGFRAAAAWRESVHASDIAPASGKFIVTRSGRVFVQEMGPPDGIPVVLFHGTAAWSELWRRTLVALRDAGFRGIAIDLPPFGFSDRPGTYTRRAQAARVEDILDALRIPEAIIVGHSFGAGAATELVMRSPERARGLVLVDAALALTNQSATPSPTPFYLRSPWLRETLVSLTITNPLATRTLLSMLIERKERAADYVPLLQRPLVIRNTTADLGVWLAYFLGDDRDALSADRKAYASITAKTAILWGDKDTVTPLSQAEDLRTLIPGAPLTILTGLGHIPQIEDPDAFNRALIAQLAAMK